MIKLEDFWQDLLESDLRNNEYWSKKIFDTNCKVHIAIMVEPYLSLILCGKKTIESRFSTKKINPFNNISKGDIVILKKTGGGIAAVFEAGDVHFIQIESETDFKEIKENYGNALCLEDEFWERKKNAKYVSLVNITRMQALSSIVINKSNRQSWLTYIRENDTTSVNNYMSRIVCIVGKIASGKTTVASELASALHGVQFSVSDYLKYSLIQTGIVDPSRTQLQELGEKLIANGWNSFCNGFLSFINYDTRKTYIIDGIRHKKFFNALCSKVYPVNPILVYLDVNDKVLEKRKHIRQEGEYDDKRLAEGNLDELRNSADFIVNTHGKSIHDIVYNILQSMESYIGKRINDANTVLQDLKEAIDNFNRDRSWNSYHNAMNLAMSISIEAAELLEMFQWSDKREADKMAKLSHSEHLREELADILIYCINLANAYEIDISSCIIEKMQKNAKKYPSRQMNLD